MAAPRLVSAARGQDRGSTNTDTDTDRESLHTRLDEIDEMTNTGGIPAGPFLGARTTRAPRDAGGPPFALSARAEPRIKGGELQ